MLAGLLTVGAWFGLHRTDASGVRDCGDYEEGEPSISELLRPASRLCLVLAQRDGAEARFVARTQSVEGPILVTVSVGLDTVKIESRSSDAYSPPLQTATCARIGITSGFPVLFSEARTFSDCTGSQPLVRDGIVTVP